MPKKSCVGGPKNHFGSFPILALSLGFIPMVLVVLIYDICWAASATCAQMLLIEFRVISYVMKVRAL